LNPTNPKFFENITAYNKLAIREHELGSAILLPEDFAAEAGFDVEAYVTKEFAKCIGRTEENAFINGTGNDQPRGFLQDALVGVSTGDITYDDVIKLYFSQKKEYRRNGVWMMSDETALKLRTLKDANGNYLWNQHDNTILGKPVYISEYMPAAQAGSRPIAFGDFSYYWIVDRAPFVMRRLNEIFALSQQIGFLGYEFIDAKLVRPEAIRVMEITE
jgi:HK97 family phage major capsid protein